MALALEMYSELQLEGLNFVFLLVPRGGLGKR
jgi:hypothetical protein